jgi:hypothetical protein
MMSRKAAMQGHEGDSRYRAFALQLLSQKSREARQERFDNGKNNHRSRFPEMPKIAKTWRIAA